MLLHSTSRLPFGKYHGISLGLIYLISPSYINWMLEETDYCVGDIEFLKSIKVINRFKDQGRIAHFADADLEEINNFWHDKVDFEDVKFSGYESFYFSNLALKNNDSKVSRSFESPIRRPVTPESERKIHIYYPGVGKNSNDVNLIPQEFEINHQGSTIIHFEADNSRGQINFLLYNKKLAISSIFWREWKISVQQMTDFIQNKTPLKGKIVNGQLMVRQQYF